MELFKIWLLFGVVCFSVVQMTAAQSSGSPSDIDNGNDSASDGASDEDSTDYSSEDSASTEENLTESNAIAGSGFRGTIQQQQEKRAQLKNLLTQNLRITALNATNLVNNQLRPPTYPTRRPFFNQRIASAQLATLTVPTSTTPTTATISTSPIIHRATIRQPERDQVDSSTLPDVQPITRNPIFRQSNPIVLTTPTSFFEEPTAFYNGNNRDQLQATIATTTQAIPSTEQYDEDTLTTTTTAPEQPAKTLAREDDYDADDSAVEQIDDFEEDDLDYNPWRDNFSDQYEDGTYVFGYSLPNGVRRFERNYHTDDGLVVEGFFTQMRQLGEHKKYELRCYRAGVFGYLQTKIAYLNKPPVVQRDVEPNVDCLHHHE